MNEIVLSLDFHTHHLLIGSVLSLDFRAYHVLHLGLSAILDYVHYNYVLHCGFYIRVFALEYVN